MDETWMMRGSAGGALIGVSASVVLLLAGRVTGISGTLNTLMQGAFPVAHIDLVEEARQLRASPMPHGHVAKTVLRNSDLRVVMMVLKRGTKVPTHHARGSLAIQILDGRLVVTLLDTGFDLAAGNVLAIEDTAVMLTVAHRQ